MTIHPALVIAPAAQDWLARTTQADVLNTFERACNLANQERAVLSLITPELSMTPCAVKVDLRSVERLTPNTPVSVQDDQLVIGDLRIVTGSARLWDSRPRWKAVRQALKDSAEWLERWAQMALAIGRPGSLLELALSPSPNERGGMGMRVSAGAATLLHGFAARSVERATEGAALLAGLGGGLTPAGDDFLVGAMLAAWAGRFGEGAEQLCAPIAETAAPLTTTLSVAYLRAAARGECTEHWHRLFNALSLNDATGMQQAIRDLLAVGHTSGADALAGFLGGGVL